MRAQEFVTEYRTPKPVLTNGQANYNGIVIKYRANRQEGTLDIQALSPQGKVLGFVNFFTGPGGYSVPLRTYRDLEAENLQVDEKYRGQGIAQTMYDFVKSQGYKIYRSDDQTDAGSGFWDKHRGEDSEVWESFNQPYPIKWEKSEHGDYDALAKLDDGTYLSIMFNNEGDDEYQIEFHRNNSQAVTGEGDAQRVFATVLQAIQEFLKVEQPWRFIFSASKDVEPGQNVQSRARLYDRLIQRYAGSWGYDVYHEDHGDQITYELTQKKITEISDERLQDYLSHAGRRVDSRLERMARARQRLDKGYEIYHAEDPDRVVHKFEANTPQLAQRYYQDYIERYESDVDYDLRLRRATGLEENVISESRLPKSIDQFLHSLTPSDVGVEEIGPYRIHFEGFTDDCKSSSDYCANPEAVYQEVFNDFVQREGGGKPVASGMIGDEDYPVLYSVFLKQIDENFADGKKPGRKGLSKRVGIPKKATLAQLQKIASSSTGERRRMAQWQLNMRRGRAKKNK